MSDADRDPDVARARAILIAAGFPVERIRILPAAPEVPGGDEGDAEAAIDRPALLAACLAILDDGEPQAAKDLARLLRPRFPGLSRKAVNSVLSVEGKGQVAYDRATYTYRKA